MTLICAPAPTRPLVVACGALAKDLRAVFADAGLADAIDVHYLQANLHYRPERIMGELAPVVEAAIDSGREVFVAYADCGTGGHLDAFLAEHPGVGRLPGAHCYEFFAGAEEFAEMHDDQPGTFYLTDFLAKHFDSLVWVNLGLDRHPQLRDVYFGNYTRLVYLAQTDDPAITRRAMDAAEQLGLAFEIRHTGRRGLAAPMERWADAITPVSIKTGTR